MEKAAMDVSPPTMTQRLYDEKKRLEERLALIDEALAAVEANPDAMRIVDAVSKLGHLGY